MNDFIWVLIIGVLFAILGLVFIRLGLAIWKKQKIELIIKHHMDKVSDKNIKAYCNLCGIGVLIAGTGFVISGIYMAFTIEIFSWIPMIIGLVTGILLLAVAVGRYNH